MARNEFDESVETTVMGRYPKPGTLLLDKYLVVSVIGTGGMGVVLKCKHIQLDDFVAIKCLLPEMMERKEIVLRFLREAKAAVKLKGEHVARVHDVGRFPDTEVPYIVMEYLEGADLNAIIKHHGAQDPSIAVDLILQACEAIAEAHSLNIIHRDIKSSNFFITQPQNESPVLKVLDFGIATAPEGTSDLTSTQSVIGTPSYMAPEQMRSSRMVDARSDIWSIGVVLYELLEGARPFRSEIYSELCLKVGMDPPIPMEHPEIPEGLRAVVFKCLEKPVEKRYQTVAELAFDLMPFASDPVTARKVVEQTARLLGRRGSRVLDSQDATDRDDDSPRRLTPPSHMMVANPISSSQPSLSALQSPVPTVLGRPTPMSTSQVKTPTSVGGSSGQVQVNTGLEQSLKPRRSGLVVGITATVVLALGGGGAWVASSQGWFGGKAEQAAAAQPPEPPPKIEPIEAVRPDLKPDDKAVEAKTVVEAKVVDKTKVEPKPKPNPTTVVAKQPVPVAKIPTPIKRPVVQPVVQKKQDPKPDPKPEPTPGGDLYNRRR
ncbi:MAG: protein kinase [Deltaproteobacteria bacterium]|nr:protein kinase [Deltaproteobacteria bacterium]